MRGRGGRGERVEMVWQLSNIFGDTVQDTMTPQTMTMRDSLNVAR